MSNVSRVATVTAAYDEAFEADGRPRPHYAALLDALQGSDLEALRAAVDERLAAAGVTFGAGTDPAPFEIDPIPRILPAAEWSALAAGLEQRVRALNAFLVDAYGERRIVAAGIVAAEVIDGAEGYEPELRGRWPGGTAPAAIAGLDVVRDADGTLLVLEDNLRTPSGLAYAAAARRAVDGVLPRPQDGVEELGDPLFAALRSLLREAAPRPGGDRPAEPSIVVLTDGPDASGWWEHAEIARCVGAALVTLADLEQRDGRVWLRAGADRTGPAGPVDVVYRRCDEDRLRDEHGALTDVAATLLEPWLQGHVAVVNAFGTGLGDDKLVHAHVEDMVRFYLGEEPLVRSVQTFDLARPEALEARPGRPAALRREAARGRRRRGRRRLRACRGARPGAPGGGPGRRPGLEHRPAHGAALQPPDRRRRAPAAAPRRSAPLCPVHRVDVPRRAGRPHPRGVGRRRARRELPSERRREGDVGAALTWAPSEPYTVGIEEEVMLLHPGGWAPAARAEDVMASLPGDLAVHLGSETHRAAVELATDPHDTVGEAVAQLAALRGRLAEELGALDLGLAGSGVHPFALGGETEVSAHGRYQLIADTMRGLARREPTFALHVHVGVAEPEAAIRLLNALRAHLPLLLALSANSPFWQGRDTGLASARTTLFGAFPRTGLPRAFASYEDWVGTVEMLLRCGAFPEATFLWWDVRPQPRFGTVEVRIMDAQVDVRRTAALCALVQALARLELEEGFASPALIGAGELLAENRFLASRDGVDAELLDPDGACAVSVRDVLARTLRAAAPHARGAGLRRRAATASTPRPARSASAPWPRAATASRRSWRTSPARSCPETRPRAHKPVIRAQVRVRAAATATRPARCTAALPPPRRTGSAAARTCGRRAGARAR